ncbi:MAG: energy-coupled thiamine transporter ThiT [Clostridiales bacterium]|nr:energy-coupled thiamine transporter ThiT [Clostridiales bacterium]
MNSEKAIRNTGVLVECAVLLAIANILSFFKIEKLFWGFGGGITAVSMLPLVIVCRRHGTTIGLYTALAHSALQMVFGLDNVQYATSFFMAVGIVMLDYIIAYTVIGLSSVFCNKKHATAADIAVGIVFSFTLRFVCHFISGWWIWDALWPNEMGMVSPVYSLVYNASYMIPEMILTAAVGIVLNIKTEIFDRLEKVKNV